MNDPVGHSSEQPDCSGGGSRQRCCGGFVARLAHIALVIFLPAQTILLNFQRSLLIINGTTGPISKAIAVELISIIMVLFVCVVFLNMAGVVAAAIAFTIGKCMSTLYLVPRQAAAVKGWQA